MDKISIIIPIYNAEKYLKKCLDSIYNQSYTNIEVIMVNDGSKDNSINICKEYCNKDKRFVLINKENEGVSVARNTGISKASGSYVMFIDADDWVEHNTCELLYKNISEEDADFVLCNHIFEFDDRSVEVAFNCQNRIINENKIKEAVILPLIERDKNDFKYDRCSFRSPWGKIFKKDIIERFNISFNADLVIGEDFIFNLNYLSKIKKAVMIDEYLFHYRINTESAINKYKENAWKLYRDLIVNLQVILKSIFKHEEYRERLDRLTIKFILTCVQNEMSSYNKKTILDKRKCIKHICSDKVSESSLKNYRYKEDNIFGINNRILTSLLKNKLYSACILYIKLVKRR